MKESEEEDEEETQVALSHFLPICSRRYFDPVHLLTR
jgi:hypothetical protein